MELEKQVCSLDLAKRLKKLRVKRESLFAWGPYGDKHILVNVTNGDGVPMPEIWKDFIPAFTVAELGELLPARIKREKYLNLLTTKREIPDIHFEIGYTEQDWSEVIPETDECNAHTEADARAKMLIYLLENKLITLPPRQ